MSISIGIVTDIHYAKRKASAAYNRYFPQGLKKLSAAVDTFNEQGVELALCLGDHVDITTDTDRAPEYLTAVAGQWGRLDMQRASLPGNHDLHSLSASQMSDILLTPCGNAFFDIAGWRIVTLRTCSDINGEEIAAVNHDWKDFYIGADDIEWLRGVLHTAPDRVVIFTHQPLAMSHGMPDEPHLVRNASLALDVICASDKVKAVIQGHYHWGDSVVCRGKPFVTLRAMTPDPDISTYSIAELDDDAIRIRGFGNQESYIIRAGDIERVNVN